jgi:hypothetical protein
MKPHDSAVVVRLDLDAVRLRHHFAVGGSTTAAMSTGLMASVADVPQLVSEVDRLGALVLEARLAYANLRAAARAALSAARDGEPDPFAYLIDELHGEWPTLPDDQSRR